MSVEQFKKLATAFLEQYKYAWQENAALRAMIMSVPMSDGTKGIPGWEQTLAEYLANEEAQMIVTQKFAPIFERIEQVHRESEVLELLRKLPPVGGVQ